MKGLLFLAVLAVSMLVAQVARQAPPPPAQPVAFSHKVHAGQLKLKCNMCHPNRDPGETMGIAAASTCMQCHSSVKPDDPEVKKIAEAAKTNRPIRWARVYTIPTYVVFSHRVHVSANSTCAECHGAVAERDVLFREADISMGGCMACHEKKGASNDCSLCHDPR